MVAEKDTGAKKAILPTNSVEHLPPNTPGRLLTAWEAISRLGLAEFAFRLGTHILLVTSILIIAWGLRQFYSLALVEPTSRHSQAQSLSISTPPYASQSDMLPAFDLQPLSNPSLSRQASLHTDLPSGQRFDTLQYTVQEGDTLVSVAAKFGLQPETILWANQEKLADNPHNLRIGQTLAILPVDGAYHRSSAGDQLDAIAKFYHANSEDILSFPGNHLRPEEIGDLTNPTFVAGTWLIIPGGSRGFVTRRVPPITRQDPAAAKILGVGACEEIREGPAGSGNFIWPTNAHYLAGYDYLPQANHPGIDVAIDQDGSVFAADSGVVVYSGWNEWGYGNLVVVDHGNDWQTVYANLSELYVVCGQIIWQGGVVGLVGEVDTSSSLIPSNPFVHFEMMFKGTNVNPLDNLP